MSPIADRVARLEQQVAALAAQTHGGEQLAPNYLTVTPGGQVGAQFTGKISASELDLTAGAGGSAIKWVTEGGALVAQLQSDGAGNLSFSPGVLSAPTIQGGTIQAAAIQLPEATATPPPAPSALQWQNAGQSVASIYAVNPGGYDAMGVQAGGVSHDLIDSRGRSDFAFHNLGLLILDGAPTATGAWGGWAGIPGASGNFTVKTAGQAQCLFIASAIVYATAAPSRFDLGLNFGTQGVWTRIASIVLQTTYAYHTIVGMFANTLGPQTWPITLGGNAESGTVQMDANCWWSLVAVELP